MEKQKSWNSWGYTDEKISIPLSYPRLLPFLENTFQKKIGISNLPAKLENIKVVKTRISKSASNQLLKIFREDQVKFDAHERLFHARGRSLPDLLFLRGGAFGEIPDAVLYPESEDQIKFIMKLAMKEKYSLIPFGGGSSVVGGVNSYKSKNQKAIVVVDMSRLKSMVSLDEISQTATFQSGIFGPDLEIELNSRGYTLGHFPQSFEFSTLGGWIASRGAGYFSDKYGKAEDFAVSLRMVAPSGIFQSELSPCISEGPSKFFLAVGNEGTFGVITEAVVKIHKKSGDEKSGSYLFLNFTDACDALREIRQGDIAPCMIRISDPEETYYFKKMSSEGKFKKISDLYLKWMGYQAPALMLVLADGPFASDTLRNIDKIVNKYKKISLGAKPVLTWYQTRYRLPYLRDSLLDYAVGSDTFETYVEWGKLVDLRRNVYKVLSELGEKTGEKYIAMSHISHTYPQGVCIYFTVLYVLETGSEIRQWQTMKNSVTESILSNGGSLSHHHGIGTDHKAWLYKSDRYHNIEVLRQIKKSLDPQNIMNPGKIFQE